MTQLCLVSFATNDDPGQEGTPQTYAEIECALLFGVFVCLAAPLILHRRPSKENKGRFVVGVGSKYCFFECDFFGGVVFRPQV